MKGVAKVIGSYEGLIRADLKDILSCIFYSPCISL
jgi:hypothetical protein